MAIVEVLDVLPVYVDRVLIHVVSDILISKIHKRIDAGLIEIRVITQTRDYVVLEEVVIAPKVTVLIEDGEKMDKKEVIYILDQDYQTIVVP